MTKIHTQGFPFWEHFINDGLVHKSLQNQAVFELFRINSSPSSQIKKPVYELLVF